MRVALDATALLGSPTGVGTFTTGALTALAGRDDTEVFAYALSWRGRTSLREVLPPGVTSGWSVPAAPLTRLWAHSDLVPAEWIVDVDDGVDVVHGTNFVVPPARRAARVVTVHDLTFARFPEMCTRATLRYAALVRRAIERGAWVHTPSAFVADEVCDRLGADPLRVRAVHHGVGLPSDEADRADPESAATAGRVLARGLTGCDRYVLALGTVEPRKDLPMLVRAFDRVAGDDPDLGLVIAGAEGWGADALGSAIDRAQHRDRIGRTGYVRGPIRLGLLAGASVFAFPSVYEGFGFPPLEAMAMGVPVVATAAGAVPEVCDGALAPVPVGDADSFAGALAAAIAAPAPLVEAGRVQAARFSWDRCADGLLALYTDARAE